MRKKIKTNDNEEKIYYKQVLLSLLLITLLVVSVICLSFSVFFKTQKDNDYSTNTNEEISMTYTEDINGISIDNALPVSDEIGMNQMGKGEYFDFTVTSTVVGDAKITYEIVAEKDLSSTISDNDIKLYLEKQKNGTYEKLVEPSIFIKNGNKSTMGAPENSMILTTITKSKSGSDNYRLKMWINETSVVEPNNFYTVRINIYGISK